MSLRPPDEDERVWPPGVPTKGLLSNESIFCPELSWWPSVSGMCYGCEIGYNGKCESLANRLLEKPGILREIYRPIPELTPQELKFGVVFYRGKFYKEDDAHKLKDKKDILVVEGKYKLTIRFIPKYEKVGHSLENKLFAKKGVLKVFPFAEIADHFSSGDELFVVRKDKKIQELLEVMEKINGK